MSVTLTLTDQEAADLRDMVSHYRLWTEWSENPCREHMRQNPPEHMRKLARQRALALRLQDV